MSTPASGSPLQAVMRSRFAQADRLEREVGELREAWSFRRHPFIRRWLDGELSAPELQAIAAEHYHAITALIEAARRAARASDGLLGEQLARYAEDQERSLVLWLRFAAATGWARSAWYFAEDPLPETRACAQSWCAEPHSLAEHLVTIHAVESAFASVAAEQFHALRAHYGFDDRATRYFAFRAQRSAGDAAVAQAGLTSLLPVTSPLELVCRAELAFRSYLELLDGVQRFAQAEF